MSDEHDEQLIKEIQSYTSSNVTANFVTILQRLAIRNKNDISKFVVGCMALGKFQDEEDFLKNLFNKFNSKAQNEIENLSVRTTLPPRGIKPKFGGNRVLLNKNNGIGEDDDDDDVELEISNFSNKMKQPSAVHTTNKILFKKINKDKARKLNEYSENSIGVSKQEASDILHKLPTAIPKLESFSINNEIKSNEIAIKIDAFADGTPTFTELDTIGEDRDWYNHDDDYGNEVIDDSAATYELNFKISNKTQMKLSYDTLHSEIQLNSLPITKRKGLLPSFLKEYGASHGISNEVVVGSLLQTSQENLINPFKNPESEFSVNAKKGSPLVAQRRMEQQNNKKNKESSNIAGTALGDVIGVKEIPKVEHDGSNTVENGASGVTSVEDIKKTRRSLPAYKARNDLLRIIRENQVTIVIGETGSGKTTQLAQYLYEDGYCSDGKLIGCTQPRRVAAMSVAKRVALEMGVNIGNEVGYSIRFEDLTSEKTRIKFLTDGILLRESLLDNTLEKYTCIIMDEAHERSLNTDVLMGIFRIILQKRKDLRLIITSATLDASKFSAFFGSAPYFTIPGRTFPVQLIYTKHAVGDYVQAAVTEAVKLHVSTDVRSGDILIFMTGQEDIEATAYFIKERLLKVYAKRYISSESIDIYDLEVFPIYSALPADIQNRIFQNFHGAKRKIVIATNIAETSLTIDGIRYVIDCGYSKLKVYNPKIGLDSLAVTPIALANANQRSGRAGRTGPGIAYRLYTEEIAKKDMYVQAIPEIQRTNLSNTVLLLKSLGVNDVLEFPFLDPPPLQTLVSSLYELWFIGALDNYGNLSSLGKEMAKFPLQPSLSKILFISSKHGCSEEMLTIVSMLSVPPVFNRPKEQQQESDLSRSRFFVAESDHLTLLNVYSQWKSNNYSHRWCVKHYLNYKSLQRAYDVKLQLAKLMNKQGIDISSSGSDWDIIRKCICSGFAHQASKLSGLGKYIHLRTGMDIQLHPTSALYGLGDLPPYVIYHELLVTTKEYICCVTSVDPFWLMQFGCLIYDIKRIKETRNLEFRNYADDCESDESEDELDLRLKEALDMKNSVIQKLQQDNLDFGKIINSKKEASKKRVERGNIYIGLKKRRPLQ